MIESATDAWILFLGTIIPFGIYVRQRINHHAEILQDSKEEK